MALCKPRVYVGSKCSVLLANVKMYLLDLGVSYSIFLVIFVAHNGSREATNFA